MPQWLTGRDMTTLELTRHPEMMNRETLYELRRITAAYPYYQPARLLLLKNLYLLHDPTFDEELRRAAIFFTDRKVIFNLVEAAHYRLKRKSPQSFTTAPDRRAMAESHADDDSRTVSLIDTFLNSIPEENADKDSLAPKERKEQRKPTAVDATTDYVAYLLATDFEELEEQTAADMPDADTKDADDMPQPKLKGGDLIDAFINNDGGKISLQEELEYTPEQTGDEEDGDGTSDEYLTETLAGIYIKQGRYAKALNIMERINETASQKNKYFEDQKRFLQLLIDNS